MKFKTFIIVKIVIGMCPCTVSWESKLDLLSIHLHGLNSLPGYVSYYAP